MPGSYLVRKRTYEILKETFPDSLRLVEIAKLIESTPMKVWDNLGYLIERGLLKKVGRGQYCFIREE